MKRLLITSLFVSILAGCNSGNKERTSRPTDHQREERNTNPDKTASWTPEQAARHQQILTRLTQKAKGFTQDRGKLTSYAGGSLQGKWTNRGPKNMPGAFKFAEMLEGTDILYGVTHNHYAGEYNSKSYIFKGTVYNPKKGTGGDDFVLLTANWPNRYANLFAFNIGTKVRLVAHIENGPLYFSDDQGINWVKSNGLPAANTSSAINRQDNHAIYVTNNQRVYVSTDFGQNFKELKNFGSNKASFLYTPRYAKQPNAATVYLARAGAFYKLNAAKTDFDQQGTYTANHNSSQFSIGGDRRALYVTAQKNYWVSTDEGANWTARYPKGNWYGDRTGKMSPGKFLAIHPENPSISIAGYAQPILSTDQLKTTSSTTTGWGRYQNGTHLSAADYYNRIRFNYHPDFQSSHFFYNSSGDLFSARCSDGGIFISYKEWKDFPPEGTAFDNSGYANAHYININVLGTVNPLIYRDNIFTGANNPNHIYYSTQDQGSGSVINSNHTDELIDFYQSIGGDGPPIDSYDGKHAWRWQREGKKVWAPVPVYATGGGFQSIGKINSQFNDAHTVEFSKNGVMGWVQAYIDREAPDQHIWMLSRDLNRASWNGTTMSKHSISKGANHVAALAQSVQKPNRIFMLQDGKVFISEDRGTTFGNGIATPFAQTNEAWGRGDMGSGLVLPTDANWILFCGPSNNTTGSILSKDGGKTWKDVTGEFPSGFDAQTSGMVASSDGSFVFAGTDIGPYVFDVKKEKWYSLAEGIGFFNAMDVDYVSSSNTVRFASWGSGILDFKIDASSLSTENVAVNDAKIQYYPIPASNNINIESKIAFNSPVSCAIFTITGARVVQQTQLDFKGRQKVQLDVSQLANGPYLLQLKDEQGNRYTKKIIIQH
ncbi:T9SS type A sorting domain-containing protein [Tenacibaculum litopenaei]|uniref:T9SS type A sorting domain-containing protein n=1 Tax=Tenacibaculum litopenaei TaxID=396016 RepID=UPI0038B585AD